MLWQRILAALRLTRGGASRWNRSTAIKRTSDKRWLRLEPLEARQLMAADMPLAAFAAYHPTLTEISPLGSSSPVGHGYSASQIRHAYGLDQVLFGSVRGDGAGQTIAIVDAYHSPTIVQDLHAFDVAFGLPDPPSFSVVAQDGSTHYPGTDPSGRGTLNWETETALDIEWAHALAPGASLLLVEAKAPTSVDLMQTAVDYARRQSNVSVISMSFGSSEFSGETALDPYFTTVPGHGGVTFVAASGDSGAPPIYPAVSTNVVAVGGTRLSLDSSGNVVAETGWSGSGGGVSYYEPLPNWQVGTINGLWRRGAPDVAFDADPASGVPVYDSYNNGTGTPWVQVGGTSFSSPAWAGVIAVANQGRAINHLASLDGAAQTLPLLYSLNTSDFRDITTGSNGLSASTGYDLVTGRGSPIGSLLIADMAIATSYGNGGGGGGGSGGGGGGSGSPSNDNFASATVLSGTSWSALGTNIAATQEAGEPNVARVSGGHSAWWTWTAAASGSVVVTTQGSDFDTTLGVFSGSSVKALTNIVSNDDENVWFGVLTSRVTFNAVAGTTYHLAVDGYHSAMGNIAIALTETISPPVVIPANDKFAQRIALSGANVQASGTNLYASVESGEPRIAGIQGGHSVWWSWTAPATGQVTISTAGSDFDTLLGVYTGTAVNRLATIATNDDQSASIRSSRVTFRAVAGTTYQIAVDGYRGATGHISLSIAAGAPAAASPAQARTSAIAVDQALAQLFFSDTSLARNRKGAG